jgi:hypothetical protein
MLQFLSKLLSRFARVYRNFGSANKSVLGKTTPAVHTGIIHHFYLPFSGAAKPGRVRPLQAPTVGPNDTPNVIHGKSQPSYSLAASWPIRNKTHFEAAIFLFRRIFGSHKNVIVDIIMEQHQSQCLMPRVGGCCAEQKCKLRLLRT